MNTCTALILLFFAVSISYLSCKHGIKINARHSICNNVIDNLKENVSNNGEGKLLFNTIKPSYLIENKNCLIGLDRSNIEQVFGISYNHRIVSSKNTYVTSNGCPRSTLCKSIHFDFDDNNICENLSIIVAGAN